MGNILNPDNPIEKLKSSKGFASVYIVIILASLMFVMLAFIEFSTQAGARLMCSDITKVTGRSVLAGYSLSLYKRYGIFAFKADENSIEKDVNSMLTADCRVSKGLIRLHAEDVFTDTSPYPALSPDILGKQISKLSAAGLISYTAENPADKSDDTGMKNVITNPSVPNDILPSGLMGYSSREILLFSGGLTDISLQSSMEDEYILAVCSDYNNRKSNTYLINETEYILFGYKKDSENLAALKRSLTGLRLAIDTAKEPEIPSDPVLLAAKLAELAAKAETEAEEIISGKKSDGFEGLNDYKDYLRLFLKLLDREEKISRLMDIMQINLQYMDGSGFAFTDYACGIDLKIDFSKDVIAPNTLGISRKIRTVEMTFEYN